MVIPLGNAITFYFILLTHHLIIGKPLGVGIFILSHVVSSDYTLGDIVFEATSATSNVGLSTGISDPSLDWSGKLILILLMWAGRLEIIPILLLIMSIAHLTHEEESAQNTN